VVRTSRVSAGLRVVPSRWWLDKAIDVLVYGEDWFCGNGTVGAICCTDG
jgi:hypothetical protein